MVFGEDGGGRVDDVANEDGLFFTDEGLGKESAILSSSLATFNFRIFVTDRGFVEIFPSFFNTVFGAELGLKFFAGDI